MIIPSGWAMPFLTSLTYTGTLVGGQQQRDTQMLEAGIPQFPQDFPTTGPYRERADVWEVSERCQWERTPPAKRVNYELLGIGNPWKVDWGSILDRRTPEVLGHVQSQREVVRPWLLSKYLAPTVLDGTVGTPDPAGWLFGKLKASRLYGNIGASAEASADDLWRDALVQVRVELRGKGTLGPLTAIYLLRDDELRICRSPPDCPREVRFTRQLFGTISENTQPLELEHSPQDVIMGYVTSGAYLLSKGRSSGTGTVALSKVVKMKRQMLA